MISTMKAVLALVFSLPVLSAVAQSKLSQNVVIVTMDGLRWQEVFGGADSLLTHDTASIYSTRYVQQRFWKENSNERRKVLMPFLWSVVENKGVILGNRAYGNHFENANPYWFSYPGYNEIFTGYPDTAVNSNDKKPNKNQTVLEFISKEPKFRNKVAVFGSWDVFAYIFNEKRSGLMVNDGFRDLPAGISKEADMYNALQHEMPDLFHGGERLDAATFNMGLAYMKSKKPRVIFLGLGDTDEFAHAGMYDYYLDAARKSDAFIRRLWEYIQSTPEYANKTTLIITTDHGRGIAKDSRWRHHGQEIPESKEMWMAAIGPSVPHRGEVKTAGDAKQGQIAATIAALLGLNFQADHPVLPRLKFSE